MTAEQYLALGEPLEGRPRTGFAVDLVELFPRA